MFQDHLEMKGNIPYDLDISAIYIYILYIYVVDFWNPILIFSFGYDPLYAMTKLLISGIIHSNLKKQSSKNGEF